MNLTDGLFVQLIGIHDNISQEIKALLKVRLDKRNKTVDYGLASCRSFRMDTIVCGSCTPSFLTRSMAPV